MDKIFSVLAQTFFPYNLKKSSIYNSYVILLIYFIGKNAFLFQEIWSQCNAMNKLIANVLENKLFSSNLFIIHRTIQIIKSIYDYNQITENSIEFNHTNIYEYLDELNIDSDTFKDIKFRDSIVYLFRNTFENENDLNRHVLNEFIGKFLKFIINRKTENNNKLFDYIKLTGYFLDILGICDKLSKLTATNIDLLINFIDENHSIEYENEIELFLMKTIYTEIYSVLNQLEAKSLVISDITMCKKIIQPALKFNTKLLYSAINIIAYNYSTKEYSDLIHLKDYTECAKKVLDIDYEKFDQIDLSEQIQFIEFSINYFDYILTLMTTNKDLMKINDNLNNAINDIVLIKNFNFFNTLLSLVYNIAQVSVKFCLNFHKNSKNGILILFKLISNEIMLKYTIAGEDKIFSHLLIDSFNNILLLIHNLSRVAYKNKPIWNNCSDSNPILILLKLTTNQSKEITSLLPIEFISYLIIANLVSDEDIIKFNCDLKKVIKYLIDKIENFAFLLETANNDKMEFNLQELIKPLFIFSKFDELKYLIYVDFNMKEILSKIIFNGNEIEQELAFKLMYQLCFDKRIANEIVNDLKLYDLIKKEQKMNNNKTCECISWIVEMKCFFKSDKQIMISYNRESRDLCLNIKNELELKFGFQCWLDCVDDTSAGNKLETILNAIEQSQCVLICMTEKYKESPMCRLEAEYVIKLNKPFVPIIMQKNYKPNGWMTFALDSSRILIDITKFEFNECIRTIQNEITSLIILNNNTNNNRVSGKSRIIIDWSNEQVMKWLKEKQFNANIVKSLEISNNNSGKCLYQLHEIYKKTPEFICNQIIAETNIKLIDLTYFLYELEKLFK